MWIVVDPSYLGVSINGGFPQQPLVFLLKMIILGCFRGTTIFGNIHLVPDTRAVLPADMFGFEKNDPNFESVDCDPD